MVHPYLRRRNGDEAVSYPSEAIRGVLEKTLGVPLFQEQAMRLAVEAAGFTPGEADQLRRAMGAWRRPGLIDQFRTKLIDGMLARGFSAEYAESVFDQIRGFGDYGFPESHAASFALLVYVSAWLKCHYPAALTAALLNSQPMGFYAPAQLVRCAREHGIEVLPVDVNLSQWECTLEESGQWAVDSGQYCSAPATAHYPLSTIHYALRLGFNMLLGMSSAHVERIELSRREGLFLSIDDFALRTRLGRPVLMRLAKAGAFGSLGLGRRDSLWHALAQDKKELPLFDRRVRGTHQDVAVNALPQMSAAEEVLADYRTMGLSLRAHPLMFLRKHLSGLGVTPAKDLGTCDDRGVVRVAGIVLVRQRPSTAKGITFVTLEDETGAANLIIRPAVWRRYRPAAAGATLLLASGQLQRQAGVIHLLTTKLEDLSQLMEDMDSQSRDFC